MSGRVRRPPVAAHVGRHRLTQPTGLGRIDESFHQVAAVGEEVLLRLGHGVKVREGPHPDVGGLQRP
jgi:hypothetical protein